jgi:putative sigma-54 modulation protein
MKVSARRSIEAKLPPVETLASSNSCRVGLDFVPRPQHYWDMKLVLTSHNIKLTDAIETHIMNRIDKLDHFEQRAVDTRVTIEHDHTKVPEKQFSCSMRLAVRGKDLFAEDKDADLYAAIDKVTKKIEQQIRKRHSKAKERKHFAAAAAKHRRQERAA